MKNMLVTGGAGFIGSNFIRHILNKHPDRVIVNLDALTEGDENLKGLNSLSGHVFVKGDITDAALGASLFEEYRFDFVVNFAAESHVDKSIKYPDVFIKTNAEGTQRLLDCAVAAWQTGMDAQGYPVYREGVKFVQISTDEVYGENTGKEKHTEDSKLAPGNPYAASKAAADLLVAAYGRTYKLPYNITRSTNNYGPGQSIDKFIPVVINNALKGIEIPVYGDGLQQRDWIHVYDNCRAIEAVLFSGRPGEIYNISANDQRTNIDVVKLILKRLGKPESLIAHVRDRLGHDRRYAIDSGKIERELGFAPSIPFEEGIAALA